MSPLSRRSILLSAALLLGAPLSQAQWDGYAGDPQHTAISPVASSPLQSIRWSTPVDDSPPGGTIYRHYGSPIVTAANTVIVPVRTSSGGYRVEAHSGVTGFTLWSAPSNYTAPTQDGGWVPSYSPTLTPAGVLYFQGPGGTLYRVDNPDSSASTPVPVKFSGYDANAAAYNSAVRISTPLTSDSAGNIYFGYEVSGTTPDNLQSGIARVTPGGAFTRMTADAASGLGGTPGLRVATNCAPAISNDGTSVYVALRTDDGNSSYLVKVDSSTLAASARVSLGGGVMFDGSTAAPMVGPNGDVYFGTLGGYHYRGVLRHFTANLTEPFAPGSFGWDITPSVVPRAMIPQYAGASSYLLMVKYNDYYPYGTGDNRLAILDPTTFEYNSLFGGNVMKEVLSISGVTLDPPGPGVREWCINTAAVDPATKSILVNSEDGTLYRWDLPSNSFTERIVLQTQGTLEAYTPTVIGPDGAVYAINKAQLFSVVPEPDSLALLALGGLFLTRSQRRLSRAGRRQ